jgi:hypothetical protein
MATVHLVYPNGPQISCPHAIGRHLTARLSTRYQMRNYDYESPEAIEPRPGDVLIGHAHPRAKTVFRLSASRPGWRRKLLMAPFNHGDMMQVGFIDRVMGEVDLFLAITGAYWFASIEKSATAHWRPKMIHLDLAVDRNEFPRLRTGFNPPGERRFLYIGHRKWYKNIPYLSRIAFATKNPISWIGPGKRAIPGLAKIGRQDFSTPEGRAAVAGHDFMITVGKADANPTTIVEAMGWGLIPVCTRESGYVNEPGIANVPLNDVREAVTVMDRLQAVPESELIAMRAANDRRIAEHYNWDRFALQAVDAIESDSSPRCGACPVSHRLRLRLGEFRAPWNPWIPNNVWRAVKRKIRGK